MSNNKQYVYGLHAAQTLLQHNAHAVKKIWVQQSRDDKRIKKLIVLADHAGVVIEYKTLNELQTLVGDVNHQGVVLESMQAATWTQDDLLEHLQELSHDPLLLILDGVQDPHNLGACLRTANAAGVDAVIIPQDRAVSLNATVRKVASGAAELTPVVQVPNLARLMRKLKEHGLWLYGLDGQAPLTLYDTKLTGPVALILGNEGQGMRRLTKDECDQLLAIPHLGVVPSLNVSVATGIALFECQRQRLARG